MYRDNFIEGKRRSNHLKQNKRGGEFWGGKKTEKEKVRC